MEPIDAVLVEHVQAGDQEALATLIERYKHRVYRVAYRITRSHEEASDIFQETFLRVARSIGRFRGESSFETWLYRIVVHLSLNALKKNERRERYHRAAWKAWRSRRVLDPHQELERKELHAQVREAIAQLSPIHRSVVVLHDLEGLTHAEIAEILECSEGTVRSRLHHARRQLRQRLRKYVDVPHRGK